MLLLSQNSDARRRYSEFESLRSGLVKLYPTLIIPPIPSKQSLGDYAIKQSKAKEDATMISRRKRMLQAFLNRIARHPILSNEHVFHRFLDSDVSWVCIQLRSITHIHISLPEPDRARYFTLHHYRLFPRISFGHLLTTQRTQIRPLPMQLYPLLRLQRLSVTQISASWTRKHSRIDSRDTLGAQWKRSLGGR